MKKALKRSEDIQLKVQNEFEKHTSILKKSPMNINLIRTTNFQTQHLNYFKISAQNLDQDLSASFVDYLDNARESQISQLSHYTCKSNENAGKIIFNSAVVNFRKGEFQKAKDMATSAQAIIEKFQDFEESLAHVFALKAKCCIMEGNLREAKKCIKEIGEQSLALEFKEKLAKWKAFECNTFNIYIKAYKYYKLRRFEKCMKCLKPLLELQSRTFIETIVCIEVISMFISGYLKIKDKDQYATEKEFQKIVQYFIELCENFSESYMQAKKLEIQMQIAYSQKLYTKSENYYILLDKLIKHKISFYPVLKHLEISNFQCKCLRKQLRCNESEVLFDHSIDQYITYCKMYNEEKYHFVKGQLNLEAAKNNKKFYKMLEENLQILAKLEDPKLGKLENRYLEIQLLKENKQIIGYFEQYRLMGINKFLIEDLLSSFTSNDIYTTRNERREWSIQRLNSAQTLFIKVLRIFSNYFSKKSKILEKINKQLMQNRIDESNFFQNMKKKEIKQTKN